MKQWLVISLMGFISVSYGFTWDQIWLTPNQQGRNLMSQKQYEAAAQVFQNTAWQATAWYRNKNYEKAHQLYQTIKTADGYYNLGNTLAQMGQLEAGIKAYDEALKQDPRHEDALFNRHLIQQLLKKQQSQKKQADQQSSKAPHSKQQQEPQSTQKNAATENEKNQSEVPKKTASNPEKKANNAPAKQGSEDKKNKQVQKTTQTSKKEPSTTLSQQEEKKAQQQWLQLVPDDPGGLMREKFLRDYLRRQKGWY